MFDRYIVDTLFKKSDIDKISALLSNKTLNPNEKDEMGYSILMEAINKSSLSVVQLLVENGSDINYEANIDGDIVDCYDVCLLFSKKHTNSKLIFLANSGIKLNIERLKFLNSNSQLFSKLNIDKIFDIYKDEIADNTFENLIPKTAKDIFLF